MTLQDFVEYLLASDGLVNPVVVLIGVFMEVMVLQQEMFASQPTDVHIRVTSNTQSIAKILQVEPFLDFQCYRLPARDGSMQQKLTLVYFREGEGVADYKWVFAQSDFVDCPVVVPTVPVVRVFSRIDLAP